MIQTESKRVAARISALCALAVLTASTIVLCAWFFGWPLLQGGLGGHSLAVRPYTALCLVIAAAGVLFAVRGMRRGATLAVSIGVAAMAAASFVEYAFHVDAGIDALFAPLFIGSVRPMRMSVLGLSSAMLVALGLFTLGRAVATLFTGAAGVIAILSLAAYTSRATVFAGSQWSTTGSPVSAALFLLLSAGLLFSGRGRFVTTLLARDRWGSMLRRVMAIAAAAPVAVTLLCAAATRAALFDEHFALALVVTTSAIILTLTVYAFVIRLRADDEKHAQEEAAARATLLSTAESLRLRVADLEGEAANRGVSIDEQARPETDARNLQRQIELLADRLGTANAEMASFSYSVSHDLRAPLRVIDGFTRELQLGYADRLDDRGRHYLERVRAGTARMGHLIDDLLALARLSRTPMQRETVDVSAMAGQIAAELEERIAPRKAVFTIEPGISAHADPRLLPIVLENLMGNAVKFSAPREQSEIAVGISAEAVFVRDNGVGFDPAYVDKLFTPFQRLHPSEFEGSGIGLAIVQRIIQRHSGRVWAESTPDRGATFFFSLGTQSSGDQP